MRSYVEFMVNIGDKLISKITQTYEIDLKFNRRISLKKFRKLCSNIRLKIFSQNHTERKDDSECLN
jgi:hypothetical protein